MLTSAEAVSSWAFIDDAPRTPIIINIEEMRFEGEKILVELRLNPIIRFVGFSIDFNADVWDFTCVTDLPIESCNLKAKFRGRTYDDLLRLYLLSCIVWRRTKVQTAIMYMRVIDLALNSMGANDKGVRFLTCENFLRRQEEISHLSYSHKTTEARQICLFLEFYETYFGKLADPELVPLVDRTSTEASKKLAVQDGWQAISDAYLIPMLECCKKSLECKNEPFQMRALAACILMASQIGMRASELCALETDSFETVSGPSGCPDLIYIKFKTFKGSRGDGNYRIARSIVNETALMGYKWLDVNCRPYREKLGVDTLMVTPKQRARYYGKSQMNSLVHQYVLSHADIIPCLNTESEFPELATTSASVVSRQRGVQAVLPIEIAVSPDDVLVYPVFHQFRVTVATKLYESGVDMRYIRQQMSHMNEDVTAGYIRSDRQIERAASEEVYEALFGDDAKLIGPHGNEFAQKVEEYVANLTPKVKSNLDEVVKAAADRYPLRRKVGGVCIRCGNVVPCKASGGTDEIYCAFGVCPNQCHMYFMIPDALSSARMHMELVDVNLARGHTKAAINELRKAQNVIRMSVVPELNDLKTLVSTKGDDYVISKHPSLEGIVNNVEQVELEVTAWLERTI